MEPPINKLLDRIRGEFVSHSWASNRAAKKEVMDWAARDEDKKNRAHRREQTAKTFIHIIILTNIVVAGVCIAAALIVRTLHLLLPNCRTWLDKDQVDTLDTLAKFGITGALGSLLTRYLNKNVDSENSNEKAPQ